MSVLKALSVNWIVEPVAGHTSSKKARAKMMEPKVMAEDKKHGRK